MTTRRALLVGGVGAAGVAVAGVAVFPGHVLRALGVDPVAKPDPADESLLAAVVGDQQHVLAVTRANSRDASVVALLEHQLRALGAAPGREHASGDPLTVVRASAEYRANDAVAARSPQLAQLFAAMASGLDLMATRLATETP